MDFYKELKTATKILKKIRRILGPEVVEDVTIALLQKQIKINYYNDVISASGSGLLAEALALPRKRIVTKKRVLTLMKYRGYTIANVHYRDDIAEKNSFRKIEVL